MIKEDDDLDEKLELWIENKDSFVIIDYKYNGNFTTAKGKVVSVSEDGDVIVKHLYNPQTSWSFNIYKIEIENCKFSPVKGDNGA